MLRPRSLCTALLVGFLSAASLPAHAAVTFTAVATASGGNLLCMMPGETLTIDVFMRSDADVSGETVFGLGASVFGYCGALTFVSGVTSATFLNQTPTGPGAGFGGLPNTLGDAPVETPFYTDEVQFLNGISLDGTPATGALDISPITEVAGGPHAQLVFTVNESATFNVGTSRDYADAVVGLGRFPYLDANNASITVQIVPDCDVPVPEPSVGWMLLFGSAALVGLRSMSGSRNPGLGCRSGRG
jgi:hypothetical protein